jgi:regulator of sigma E protease
MVVNPAKLDTGWKLGFEAVPPPMRNDPQPTGKAIDKAAEFCRDKSLLIVEVLQGLFTRKVAVSQLSGPVGIARMAGQAASMRGWFPKIGLAAAISLNLGILNLMPFPILDGGLILLLLIESVIRHDISVNVKERIYQAAFVVLVVFFAFIIFNDVTKLPIFTHVKP